MAYDRSGLDNVGGVSLGAKAGISNAETMNGHAQKLNSGALDFQAANRGPSIDTQTGGLNMHAVAAGKHTVHHADYSKNTSLGERDLVQGEDDSYQTQKVTSSEGDRLVGLANNQFTA